jgi:hypothetical protein
VGEVIRDAESHSGGRRVVNCSEWDRRQHEARASATALRRSATERLDLLRGLEAPLCSPRAGATRGTVEGIAITE